MRVPTLRIFTIVGTSGGTFHVKRQPPPYALPLLVKDPFAFNEPRFTLRVAGHYLSAACVRQGYPDQPTVSQAPARSQMINRTAAAAFSGAMRASSASASA